MNWISALASKKITSDTFTSSDQSHPSARSLREEAQLLRLREVLAMKHWNFGPGSVGFDGFSQGICFLGGIYPEGSHSSSEYGPRFLPGALQSYGFSGIVKSAETGHLRETVTEHLNYLRGLQLRGFETVKDAINAASKIGANPCWLEVAASDFQCACYLPIEFQENDKVRARIKHLYAKAGGNARASKDKKTQLINSEIRKIFEALRSQGFSKDLLTHNGKPVAKRISNVIYFKIINDENSDIDDPPSVETIAYHISKWLKNGSAESG
jgi:hypothetical protein